MSSENKKHENDVTSERTIDWLVFSRASAFFSPFFVPLLSPEQQSHALFIIQTIYGFIFYSLAEISWLSAPSAADCLRLAWLVIEGNRLFNQRARYEAIKPVITALITAEIYVANVLS